MIYYHKSRLDGLSKRHETTHELTDYFIDCDNFLIYRKAIFDSQLKKVGPVHRGNQRPMIVFIFQNKIYYHHLFCISIVNY